MKRFLLLLGLLLLAGCWFDDPVVDSCSAVHEEGLVPLECDDFVRSDDGSSLALIIDRPVQSASFVGEQEVSCERMQRGDVTEVVCDGFDPEQPILGNISGQALFDLSSHPYIVQVSVR